MNTCEMGHSEQLGELFAALAKAQSNILTADKDAKNPFFKSDYSTLASTWEACRKPLTENGLSVIQTVEGTKDCMFIVTWLGHSSGQWMRSKLPLIIQKQDLQGIGSAISYGRRYSLAAICGVVSSDDDGEAAMKREGQKKAAVASPEEVKKKTQEFFSQFDITDEEWVNSYLQAYAKHYKKTIYESILDYSDPVKFLDDLAKWRSKEIAKNAEKHV